jgi:DNA (cytosine-5)-methyltransferase 1
MVNYSCSTCQKVFTQKGHFETHQRRKRPCKKDNTIERLVEEKVKEVLAKKETMQRIKFIDLFCGIGGFHQALKNILPESECILASDIDENARKTYENNHKLKPLGDIKQIDISSIAKFDLICGGFPCQTFSIAQWKDKKAFDDPRGTLFFDILKIIEYHKPKAILLENVANLVTINKGNVMNVIVNSLKVLGYNVSYQILSPTQFNIPQNRDRVYIVASLVNQFDFTSLSVRRSICSLRDIIDKDTAQYKIVDSKNYTLLSNENIKKQSKSGLKFCGYINGNIRKTGAKPNTEHLSRVHKQTMRIYSLDGCHPTLTASETSGRYHVYDEKNNFVRFLTLNECYRLMAYPDNFIKHETKGVSYKQIGNSICVKVVEEVLREMIRQNIL